MFNIINAGGTRHTVGWRLSESRVLPSLNMAHGGEQCGTLLRELDRHERCGEGARGSCGSVRHVDERRH